jgi:uncharacterized protein YciI
MFIVLLRFSTNPERGAALLAAHNEWIKKGFDDGVFLVVGRLEPKLGGGIVAYATSRQELQNRIDDDPFVVERVVTAEIFEVLPSRADPRLTFLIE